MNRLTRNLALCVKNNYKTRTIVSFVYAKSIENRRNAGMPNEYLVQPMLCGESRQCNLSIAQTLRFSSDATTLPQLDYEHFCAETLESLTDYIEELVESVNHLSAADVVNKDGVLTVNLGPSYGTYVINKQSPNKQIWLSSPNSGPKRFDFVHASNSKKAGYWLYKHTGETLHELLDKEFSEITKTKTDFLTLSFGSRC